jgi:hypothetical protein
MASRLTTAKDKASPNDRPRTISPDACRDIEETLGLEHAWMGDSADSTSGLSSDQVKLALQIAALLKAEQVRIQHCAEFELATLP